MNGIYVEELKSVFEMCWVWLPTFILIVYGSLRLSSQTGTSHESRKPRDIERYIPSAAANAFKYKCTHSLNGRPAVPSKTHSFFNLDAMNAATVSRNWAP